MDSIRIGKGCTIRPQESGTWQIRFERGGRRRRFTIDTTNKIKAISHADELFGRWMRSEFDPWRDTFKVTRCEEAIEHYVREHGRGLSDGGKENAWTWRRFTREAGIDFTADVTGRRLRKFIYDYRNEQTRLTNYTKLSGVLSWLTEKGYFDKNPLGEVKRPRSPKRVPKYYEERDLEKFLAAAPLLYDLGRWKKYPRNPYWYVDAFHFYLYTGVRRAEGPRVTWGDVIWPAGDKLGRLIVRDTKKGKDRPVPLTLALPLLERLYNETRISDSPDEVILKTHDGVSPISGPYLGRKFAQVAELAKLKNVGLHGLRHTFAVDMLRSGVSMRSVQIMLGHDDIHTTMIYTTLTEEDVLRDVERAKAGK